MKKLLLLALSMQIQSSFAGIEMPCEKIEYARLKDSTQKELLVAYCSAIEKSELNKKFKEISSDLFNSKLALGANTKETEKDISARADAQVSCLKVAEDISSMLTKKFKTKPSACSN